MKMFLTISLTLSALLLSGCNSSSSSKSEVVESSTIINVERGKVLSAYVKDSKGVRAEEVGNGQYKFNAEPTYPLYCEGGYIDVDGNGEVNSGDVVMKYNLSSTKNNLTLLTTLSQNQNMKNYFLNNLGLSEEELYSLPTENIKVSAISDEIYKYCVENNLNLSELKEENLTNLGQSFQNRIGQYQNMQGNPKELAMQNEKALVNNLNCPFVTEANIIDANEVVENATNYFIGSNLFTSMEMQTYDLRSEQIDDLKFIYEEEKLARDVYYAMYEKWGLNAFLNISRSEETHMSSVKSLLDKYSISIETKARGLFVNSELQNLYTTLVTRGNASITDALNVGIDIEELDISDLENIISRSSDDVKIILEDLKAGSYNHLSAFKRLSERF